MNHESPSQPIFLLGAHKSGTSLLRSLLDGHPDLFVLPFETHFLQLANYWVDYRLRRALPPLRSIAETKQAYTQLVEHYNVQTDPTADATLTGLFDLDRFRRELDPPAADMVALFQVYARAVYASLTGEALTAGRRVVEKSTENAELALDLKQLFPAAKFIHIVRNPYANVVAIRRHHSRTGKRVNFKNRFPVLITNLPALKNSYYHLYHNRRLLDAGDYLVIRYEDLLTIPEATMQTVAGFLSIPFTDGLLQPTSLGQDWQGNSSRGISYSGISAKNLALWRREISHLELHYVNRYFKFVLDDYGYETLAPRRPVLWPVRREGPLTYIANRLLPFYL
jgi:protein-tyrosine sulfotransferase